MIKLEQYDLKNEEDVFRLGAEIGKELAHDVLTPMSHAIRPELSVIFYAAVLAAPFGSMYAAVGAEGSEAIISKIRDMSAEIGEMQNKNKH